MTKMFEVLALMPPQKPGMEANPTGQMIQMIGMFVILGAMFYFLMIRPQQKQRKEHENLLKNIKAGDKILTTAGIYGIVTSVKDKTLMVKIADNVKVEITKTAVTTVVQKGEDVAGMDSK